MPLSADMERVHRTRELVEQLINDPRRLGPDYEPVVRLADRKIIGVKATGRGSPGTDLADTLTLLDGARSLGLVERLDWAFRALSFDDMLGRDDLELHLTPEPETFGTACPPRFAAAIARGRRELTVAAEVHADSFGAGVALEQGLREIREWGWRVVIADVADDHTAVDGAASIRPDIVQIDLRLPGRAPGSASAGSPPAAVDSRRHGGPGDGPRCRQRGGSRRRPRPGMRPGSGGVVRTARAVATGYNDSLSLTRGARGTPLP